MRNLSRFSRLVLTALVVVSLSLLARVAVACPSCEAALAQSREGAQAATGYFWSILFMMSMPFLLLSAFGGLCYRMYRVNQQQMVIPAERQP